VWYLRPQETEEPMFAPESDTWNVSRVCGTFKEREGWHGCQMPIAVLDRIIKSSSNPGDIVLDPFNGSGTTTVSAAILGRQYVGIDQSEAYVSYARKRLEHALQKAANVAGEVPANRATDSQLFPGLHDPKRSSKVMTETDAFGRKRVARRRAAKTA
jgi:DNA modification methylase